MLHPFTQIMYVSFYPEREPAIVPGSSVSECATILPNFPTSDGSMHQICIPKEGWRTNFDVVEKFPYFNWNVLKF